MNRLSAARVVYRITDISWAVMLLVIPVTSSPWVAALTGKTSVSPLAGVPLLLLVLLWLIPFLLRKGAIPRISLPLLFFVGVALLSGAAAFFLPGTPIGGQTFFGRQARAFLTLAIGVSFYLVVSTYPRSVPKLRSSLKWIYAGAILMLIWSSWQAFYVILNYVYEAHQIKLIPQALIDAHRIFSIRDPFARRVTGLAYEPSWLADLLVVLYLPLWIASIWKRYSIYRLRFRWITVEMLLFLWATAILLLTQSRVGFVSFFAVAGAVLLRSTWEIAGRIRAEKGHRREGTSGGLPGRFTSRQLFTWLSILVILSITAVGVFWLAGRVDERIGSLFETDYLAIIKNADDPYLHLANTLYSGERVIYWVTGFRIFSEHPILGVGLGGAGFYFIENLPAFGTRLPEILRILSGEAFFPNLKSIWFRLLAETGIVGFSAFVVWLVVLMSAAGRLLKTSKGLLSVIALASLLAMIAFILEGFSLDTFALPQVWVIFGLLTAAVSARAKADPTHSPQPVSDGQRIDRG